MISRQCAVDGYRTLLSPNKRDGGRGAKVLRSTELLADTLEGVRNALRYGVAPSSSVNQGGGGLGAIQAVRPLHNLPREEKMPHGRVRGANQEGCIIGESRSDGAKSVGRRGERTFM